MRIFLLVYFFYKFVLILVNKEIIYF